MNIFSPLKAGIPMVVQAEGPNPLTSELMLTATELRSKERQQALRGQAARSPSTSHSNLAYLLDGYRAAGGSKYAEVSQQLSQRIQQILVACMRASNRHYHLAHPDLYTTQSWSTRLVPGGHSFIGRILPSMLT